MSVQLVPREMMVLRFRPMAADALVRKAEQEFVRIGHYGLSVFADQARDDEQANDTLGRLLDASELDGIKRDPRFWLCTEAGNLLDCGFVFLKDDEPGELPEHYCVSLGDTPPSEDRAAEFASQFAQRRREDV